MVNKIEGDYLFFNGRELHWMKNEQQIEYWLAMSGKRGKHFGVFQTEKGVGPIPEGEWAVKQIELQKRPKGLEYRIDQAKMLVGGGRWRGGEGSWGNYRIWLYPINNTITYGRSGFSIHGGDEFGSAGCIDLRGAMSLFVGRFISFGKDLVLIVEYE